MSRPFSYNDENFTVIGNLLVVHVSISGKAYVLGQSLIKIPPAIFNRMKFFNQQATISNKFTGGAAGVIGVTCTEDGDFITRTDINASSILPRYICTWYVLKDI